MDGAERLAEAEDRVRRGDFAGARDMLMSIVARDPAHYEALMRLAHLLRASHHRRAARLTYEEVLRHYPADGLAHLERAHMAREDEDWVLAQSHYLQALANRPDLRPAHQGLSYVLLALGDAAGARQHRDLGFRGSALYEYPFRGQSDTVRVLLLVSALGGNTPVEGWFDPTMRVTVLVVEYWDESPFPPHDVLVNAVSDADWIGEGLGAAEVIVQASGRPAFNPPARIRGTGRLDVRDQLAAIPDVVVPRMEAVTRADLHPRTIAFPLLVRAVGFHTGQHFVGAASSQELERAVDTMPGDRFWIIERLPTVRPDGTFRKMRIIAVGARLYPLHYAVSTDWKVHYYRSLTDLPQYQTEEDQFLTDMQTFLGGRATRALHAIAAVWGLDYLGIDFDVASDGRVLVFEANATMVVPIIDETMRPTRREALEAIRQAVQDRVSRLGRRHGEARGSSNCSEKRRP